MVTCYSQSLACQNETNSIQSDLFHAASAISPRCLDYSYVGCGTALVYSSEIRGGHDENQKLHISEMQWVRVIVPIYFSMRHIDASKPARLAIIRDPADADRGWPDYVAQFSLLTHTPPQKRHSFLSSRLLILFLNVLIFLQGCINSDAAGPAPLRSRFYGATLTFQRPQNTLRSRS